MKIWKLWELLIVRTFFQLFADLSVKGQILQYFLTVFSTKWHELNIHIHKREVLTKIIVFEQIQKNKSGNFKPSKYPELKNSNKK
jgi:hypothetical protein